MDMETAFLLVTGLTRKTYVRPIWEAALKDYLRDPELSVYGLMYSG